MVLGSKAVNRKSNAEDGAYVTPMQRRCQWRIICPAPSPFAQLLLSLDTALPGWLDPYFRLLDLETEKSGGDRVKFSKISACLNLRNQASIDSEPSCSGSVRSFG